MVDVITGILDSKIDYQTIFTLVGLYIVSLWLMFCLWVFVDAYKRYGRFYIAALMGFLVLIFNFPALIFYLIIRPEEDVFAADYGEVGGGIQMPVAQFIGRDGQIEMSLNLGISPKVNAAADMKIDVAWDSSKPEFKQMTSAANSTSEQGTRPTISSNAQFNSWKQKAAESLKRARTSFSSSIQKVDDYKQQIQDEQSDTQTPKLVQAEERKKSKKNN